MKTAISFILFAFLFSFKASAKSCSLKREILSLSGPFTMLLEEFSLLKDKKLKGISHFHPILDMSINRVPGGMFLSRKTFQKYKKTFIVFDKSRELKRNLKREGMSSLEIDTRGLSPYIAHKHVFSLFKKELIHCKKEISKFEQKIASLEQRLRKLKIKRKMIFFLGKIPSLDKLPNMVMANDGPVLFLRKKGMQTYHSDLAYVNWSAKLMKLYDDFLLVGLSNGKSDNLKIKTLSKKKINISYRGALVPGLRQLYFLDLLAHKFFY